MYQTLIDKSFDTLAPIFLGVCLWFLGHYFFLTERILKVEMPREYSATMADIDLPQQVHTCFIRNYSQSILKTGRFEASIYTASLRFIEEPFRRKSFLALESLDDPCGKSKALKEQQEHLRQLALEKEIERARQAELLKAQRGQELERLRQRAEEEAFKRQVELEKLKQKAEEEAEKRQKELINNYLRMLIRGLQ